MANEIPAYEMVDVEGNTFQESSTVGAAPINVPAVSGEVISEFIIQCPPDQSDSVRLFVSVDGVNFLTMTTSGFWGWTPKGEIRQLILKANEPGVKYEVVLNREPK